ncbi:MAG: hypothetical protein B6D58_01195 [candidate division Zixibacteria bacterium 4484_95]|nr:MAG: hypothetical protein B6D58_01195 [candidate division Zixibacteria bacterium 4484_95]RKX17228.1 MAG: DUF456 domain-containing protein [candidate division Zixibacteria bacterium]
MNMPWYEIVFFILALIVMVVGLIGIVLPVLPGVPLIFVAAFVYALLTGFKSIGGQALIILGILTIVSLVLDWLATVLGVKKMGGSKAGMIGALIGMIAGLLLPGVGFIGFIIGAFVGALVFELLVCKEPRVALRAGLGSFIGFLAGSLIKFVISVVMIGIFIWNVLF